MSEPENITAEEGYNAAYNIFWDAVFILAQDANGQCAAMGHYNVAWELKYDVSAENYLFNSPLCRLSAAQKDGVTELIRMLQSVPDEVLVCTASTVENQRAMSHVCWEPLRVKAEKLLSALPTPEER